MFDFASAGRKEGDTPGVNDKGLVTRDRKVRKDAFYFYQANWTTQPIVYITSRRDCDRTIAQTPIKVYSNLPRRSAEHTSELQSRQYLVCRLLLETKTPRHQHTHTTTTPHVSTAYSDSDRLD